MAEKKIDSTNNVRNVGYACFPQGVACIWETSVGSESSGKYKRYMTFNGNDSIKYSLIPLTTTPWHLELEYSCIMEQKLNDVFTTEFKHGELIRTLNDTKTMWHSVFAQGFTVDSNNIRTITPLTQFHDPLNIGRCQSSVASFHSALHANSCGRDHSSSSARNEVNFAPVQGIASGCCYTQVPRMDYDRNYHAVGIHQGYLR